MNTRITLRLNKELDDLIEEKKKETGLSKNQIIVTACKQLVETESKKNENI